MLQEQKPTRIQQHHHATSATSCLPTSRCSGQRGGDGGGEEGAAVGGGGGGGGRGGGNKATNKSHNTSHKVCVTKTSILAEHQSDDSNSNPNRTSNKARRSRNSAMQRKVTISVFIIVGCYMFFTMPLFITGLVHWVSNHPINIPRKVSLIAHWLFIGKSACNPVLLACINPQVQSGFKELMGFLNIRYNR